MEENEVQQYSGSGTLTAIVKAELDQQITTAKAYPRSIDRFKKSALAMATLDQQTAASCFYAVPRDGKMIEGPSARLAEIVVAAWQNIRAGARVVDEGERFISAQGVCHDLENNVAITMDVKRRITKKNGQRYGDDMIVTTGNAAASIALRNAVLKVVPKAFWWPVYLAARKTAIGDAKTLSSRRVEMMAYFQKMGVPGDRVLAVVGKRSVEDVGLDDLTNLIGLATAIRDGDTTVDEAFPAEASKTEAINAKLDAAAGQKNGNHPTPPKPEQPEAKQDAPQREVGDEPPEEGDEPTQASKPEWIALSADIENAQSADDFKFAGSVLKKLEPELGQARYAAFLQRFQQRYAERFPAGKKPAKERTF